MGEERVFIEPTEVPSIGVQFANRLREINNTDQDLVTEYLVKMNELGGDAGEKEISEKQLDFAELILDYRRINPKLTSVVAVLLVATGDWMEEKGTNVFDWEQELTEAVVRFLSGNPRANTNDVEYDAVSFLCENLFKLGKSSEKKRLLQLAKKARRLLPDESLFKEPMEGELLAEELRNRRENGDDGLDVLNREVFVEIAGAS